MSKELFIGSHKIEKPIILGAMSVGLTKAPLVAIVADAGGVGTIGGSGLGYPEFQKQTGLSFDEANREALREEIRKARRLTKGVVGVNVLRAMRDFKKLAEAAIDEDVDIFACGAGTATDLPLIAQKYPFSETALVPVVSSKLILERICRLWKNLGRLPDAVIVEGPKAGGHLGFSERSLQQENRQLPVIVRSVVDYLRNNGLKIPVIAAGGIWDKKDMEYYLSDEVGADAVQMATRFILTEECSAGGAFKRIHQEAAKRGTVIIESPVGLKGRAVRNGFTDKITSGQRIPGKCAHQCLEHCKYRETGETLCILNALTVARLGNIKQVEKHGLVFAGEYAGRDPKIVPARDIINSLL